MINPYSKAKSARSVTRAAAAAAAAQPNDGSGGGAATTKPVAKKAKKVATEPPSPPPSKKRTTDNNTSDPFVSPSGKKAAVSSATHGGAGSNANTAEKKAASLGATVPDSSAGGSSKKNLALKIAIENGVDATVFSQYDICLLLTGAKVPTAALSDTSNPQRVFSVVDASSKRFAVDACYDMVHAVATAFALEAQGGGDPYWNNVTVVMHDSMAEAMKAVHESGATVLVPCVSKDDVMVESKQGPSTPMARVLVGGAKSTGETTPSPCSTSASGGTAAAGGGGAGGVQSPSVSPSKQLNLDNMDLKVNKKTLQKFRNAKGVGGIQYRLTVHLSGFVTTSGRDKTVGVFTLTDTHGNPYYAFKSDAVIDTFRALTEVPPLAALTDFSKSLVEVDMRDIPSGADVGKVSYSKKTGSAFPVTATMFSLDLSEKIRPPEEEIVSLMQMVHEVIGSKVFKETYIDICVNGGRWENLFGRNGAPPETHSIWQILKNCGLNVVSPSPLDTTLLDKDIVVAMAYLTNGVPPHGWSGDPLLSKVAYKEGQVPTGMFRQDG